MPLISEELFQKAYDLWLAKDYAESIRLYELALQMSDLTNRNRAYILTNLALDEVNRQKNYERAVILAIQSIQSFGGHGDAYRVANGSMTKMRRFFHKDRVTVYRLYFKNLRLIFQEEYQRRLTPIDKLN